jgi:CubicO group peptidase (beta-lactamase class C family)
MNTDRRRWHSISMHGVGGIRFRLTASLLLCTVLAPAQDYLDQAVERARRDFDVPGIAIAIVKDGRVALAKGYGVRRIGQPEPVTAHSLFRIASNTKAFTAAALAMLVDEGKIGWDDRVVDHLAGFQLYDPYVTRELTVRDLLTHRSGLGLGAGDLMFFPPSDLSREEIMRRLRFIKPATSFRSRYAYDNLLYLVAGSIIPAVTGQSWDEFVRRRIFVPLGMTSTGNTTEFLQAAADVAIPHSKNGGKLEPLPHENVDNNAPAGSIVSCAADMARWVMLQLNHGEFDGVRLFSEKQSREMWTPQTILPIDPAPLPALAAVQPNFRTYGLGWHLDDYRGRKVVWHSGELAGYYSRATMLPELNLGMIVFTNQEEDGVYHALSYTILDHYLGVPPTDWVGVFHQLAQKQTAEADAITAKSSGRRNAASHPSLPAAAYAGRYRDPWYGDVLIAEGGGKLSIHFTHTPALAGSLEHWQYDTFVARWNNRTLGADAYVTFWLKPDGSIDQVRMSPVSPLTDFSFDFQDLDLRPIAPDAPPR